MPVKDAVWLSMVAAGRPLDQVPIKYQTHAGAPLEVEAQNGK